jgi:hypothetical protein
MRIKRTLSRFCRYIYLYTDGTPVFWNFIYYTDSKLIKLFKRGVLLFKGVVYRQSDTKKIVIEVIVDDNCCAGTILDFDRFIWKMKNMIGLQNCKPFKYKE